MAADMGIHHKVACTAVVAPACTITVTWETEQPWFGPTPHAVLLMLHDDGWRQVRDWSGGPLRWLCPHHAAGHGALISVATAPKKGPRMPKPSIGRDVHYVSRGSADGAYRPACRAAKITEVGEGGRVGLVVFNPDCNYFFPLTKEGGCAYYDKANPGLWPNDPDMPGAPGSWHWPEQVEE
jgi:hypothetical protein